MADSPSGPCYCHNTIFISSLRSPQRDKSSRISSRNVPYQNLSSSSKNYLMKPPKYTPLKQTFRYGKCTSTEHREPSRAQDWWLGLESSSFRPETMSSRAHSPLSSPVPTTSQNTMPCSLACNSRTNLEYGTSKPTVIQS